MKIEFMPVAYQIQYTELDNVHREKRDFTPAVIGLNHDNGFIFFIYIKFVAGTCLGQNPLPELPDQSIV